MVIHNVCFGPAVERSGTQSFTCGAVSCTRSVFISAVWLLPASGTAADFPGARFRPAVGAARFSLRFEGGFRRFSQNNYLQNQVAIDFCKLWTRLKCACFYVVKRFLSHVLALRDFAPWIILCSHQTISVKTAQFPGPTFICWRRRTGFYNECDRRRFCWLQQLLCALDERNYFPD